MESNKNSSRRRQDGKKSTPLSRKPQSKKPLSRKPLDKKTVKKEFKKITPNKTSDETSGIRLNKYIANSGICSRREADTYIEHGSVQVNGKLVTEMGYKVQPDDIVQFDGTSITPEQKKYVLLNKPKNYITTMEDDRGRKTVMELIANASKERIYPVGRLDRNTTGLLLFTNDGDLAKKLTHPKHNVRKLYHASLDKKLELRDLEKLRGEVVIEGKKVFIDAVSYVNGEPKTEIGIEIHSGRNRIVRKIFEHVGYKVNKLDRVIFAELTKKNLPRGRWRELTNLEVNNLQMMK
ncbi:pseudouridine synthase [Polaribacter vadi]|uniref:Pseudouridine synthase n=1 Tax=Polaribacter vadi TaxID=1774273 RepID=A0A1B8U316_9FLAO|nr:pseudouridine synthase [Polaribacter vadi]AOW17319.1 pseudouridine synthase [Polaribacter vadi]OBY66256.1 pseudouridine synthase [Polaribacter vadi]|tara:strand:- start:253 stop:1131 length:879 start_codon:yes stop_codon:yes gene_type:complete